MFPGTNKKKNTHILRIRVQRTQKRRRKLTSHSSLLTSLFCMEADRCYVDVPLFNMVFDDRFRMPMPMSIADFITIQPECRSNQPILTVRISIRIDTLLRYYRGIYRYIEFLMTLKIPNSYLPWAFSSHCLVIRSSQILLGRHRSATAWIFSLDISWIRDWCWFCFVQ